MAEEKDFKYDPEAGGEDTKKLRLPFALCKSAGIKIQDWWTPRDAWNALKNGGIVDDVSEEYADYYRKLKRERQKEFDKANPERVAARKARAKTKKNQLANPEHNPDKNYTHQDGKIAGSIKGKPMSFEQADNGNVNPYFMQTDKSTGIDYIGYKTNCQTCVATYVARRLGYNVSALPNLNNKNIMDLSHNTSLAYKDSKGQTPKLQKVKSVTEVAFNMKAGEIYSLQYDYPGRSAGHIVVMEKRQDGSCFIYDPQVNYKTEESGFRGYQKGKANFRVMNLTNVQMDETFCDSIMKGVKK